MRRYGIEADVGEENHCRTGKDPEGNIADPRLADERVAEETDPRVSKRGEGMPILWIDIERPDHDDEQDDGQFDDDHSCIESGALPDAIDQYCRDDRRDGDGRNVKIGSRGEKGPCYGVVIKRSRTQGLRYVYSETAEEVPEMRRPAMGDGR